MSDATLSRRNFLGVLLAAPAIIRTPGLLMPVKAPLIAHNWQTLTGGVLLPPAVDGEIYHIHNHGDWPIAIQGYGLVHPNTAAFFIRVNGVWVTEGHFRSGINTAAAPAPADSSAIMA